MLYRSMSLAALLERAARLTQDGRRITTGMKGLLLFGQRTPSTFASSLYEPVVCLILQGRKETEIGEQTLSFGAGECLLVSHDLPVRSRITKAPYLALVLELEVASLRRLYDEVAEAPRSSERASAAVTFQAAPELLDAFHRYLALATSPRDAHVLGPLILKELHYRLLMAPIGGMLRSLLRHDSDASAISRAIGHLRAELRSPVAIPELARRVGMSASSFHKHFKAITSTTPLQYQKELRLLEARRLLRAGAGSVAAAAYEVGYESASQFSREYVRKFGGPPSRDLAEGGDRRELTV